MRNKEENLHAAYIHNLQLFVCTYNVSIWTHKYCKPLLIRMFNLVTWSTSPPEKNLKNLVNYHCQKAGKRSVWIRFEDKTVCAVGRTNRQGRSAPESKTLQENSLSPFHPVKIVRHLALQLQQITALWMKCWLWAFFFLLLLMITVHGGWLSLLTPQKQYLSTASYCLRKLS